VRLQRPACVHGLVLAIKNGVPALAIEPVSGESKLTRQAEVHAWPAVKPADRLDQGDLRATLDFCLGEEAGQLARRRAEGGAARLEPLRDEFVVALSEGRGRG
jgi:hypothetical protein